MRITRLFIVVAATLGACQSAPRPIVVVPAPAHTVAAVIHGRAFFLERMALLPGSTLDVQLIDALAADKDPATIARQRFDGLQGPPFDFDLPYDPGRIVDAPDRYSLRATLRDARGHLEFFTDTRAAVVPGADRRVEFRLVRAGAG
jgi:uncharacterized lipoprotein YbaY